MLAYLVIRDGTKWSDVFRLTPGRRVTIGRAATNQIIVRDEQASRQHAEIFTDDGQWFVRDLESRNGTQVGEEQITGDFPLNVGDVVRIANTQLAFVTDLTAAYGGKATPEWSDEDPGSETVMGKVPMPTPAGVDETCELVEPTTITHRRNNTRLLDAPHLEAGDFPKLSKAAAKLCKLAFDLAQERDAKGVAQIAINGLVDGTQADAGAVLLASRSEGSEETGLRVLASRSDRLAQYRGVSSFLSETVLGEGEAVLARNIEGDSKLGIRDSAGEILSTSVILRSDSHSKTDDRTYPPILDRCCQCA